MDAFCGCGGNAIAFARRPENEIAKVICIDIDRSRLRMAANNASLYEIPPSRIIFIEADAVDVLGRCYKKGKLVSSDCSLSKPTMEEVYRGFTIGHITLLPSALDGIFLSPPWGGMSYLQTNNEGYSLASCLKVSSPTRRELQADSKEVDVDGEELLKLAAEAAPGKNVVYFLPRNLNGISFGRSALAAGYRGTIEIEQNYLNGKFKTITAYLSQVQIKGSDGE